MTTITKQLAGVEDLLLGSTTVTQTRQGQQITLHGISAETLPLAEMAGPSIADSIPTVVQESGDSETDVMSQKAVTDLVGVATTVKGTWQPTVTGSPALTAFESWIDPGGAGTDQCSYNGTEVTNAGGQVAIAVADIPANTVGKLALYSKFSSSDVPPDTVYYTAYTCFAATLPDAPEPAIYNSYAPSYFDGGLYDAMSEAVPPVLLVPAWDVETDSICQVWDFDAKKLSYYTSQDPSTPLATFDMSAALEPKYLAFTPYAYSAGMTTATMSAATSFALTGADSDAVNPLESTQVIDWTAPANSANNAFELVLSNPTYNPTLDVTLNNGDVVIFDGDGNLARYIPVSYASEPDLSPYAKKSDLNDYAKSSELADVATSGKASDLENDAGFVTTDTTYNAGDGIALEGTTFKLEPAKRDKINAALVEPHFEHYVDAWEGAIQPTTGTATLSNNNRTLTLSSDQGGAYKTITPLNINEAVAVSITATNNATILAVGLDSSVVLTDAPLVYVNIFADRYKDVSVGDTLHICIARTGYTDYAVRVYQDYTFILLYEKAFSLFYTDINTLNKVVLKIISWQNCDTTLNPTAWSRSQIPDKVGSQVVNTPVLEAKEENDLGIPGQVSITDKAAYFCYAPNRWMSLKAWASAVPASSTAAGIKGQVAADSSYLYVCHDTNSWIKIAKEPEITEVKTAAYTTVSTKEEIPTDTSSSTFTITVSDNTKEFTVYDAGNSWNVNKLIINFNNSKFNSQSSVTFDIDTDVKSMTFIKLNNTIGFMVKR